LRNLDYTNFEFETNLETSIHEIIHVLVFDPELMKLFKNPDTGVSYEKVLDNYSIVTPYLKEWA